MGVKNPRRCNEAVIGAGLGGGLTAGLAWAGLVIATDGGALLLLGGSAIAGALGGGAAGAVVDGTADACDDAAGADNVDQTPGDGDGSSGDDGDGNVDYGDGASVDQGNVDPGDGSGDDGTCTCSYVPIILAAGAWAAIRGSKAQDARLEVLAFSSSLIGATLGTAGYLNRKRIAKAMARLAS